MLIELWEKIRGYDTWVETTATLKSSQVEQEIVGHDKLGRPFYGWRGDEELVWTDTSGVGQCEPLTVSEGSPVFQCIEGNAVRIRYNPADSGDFYVREQLQYEVSRSAKIILWTFAIVIAIVALLSILLRD
jgi:hypothetical protein